MDGILARSLFLNLVFGLAMVIVALGNLINPSTETTCVGNVCGPTTPVVDPWAWGVLLAGTILLLSGLILGIIAITRKQ